MAAEVAEAQTWRARFLERMARWAYEHPWRLVLGGIALALASLFATQKWLVFRTSRDDLISTKEAYVQVYKAYQREFGDRDDVVIVVHAPRLQRAKEFARGLAERLEGDPAAAREVLYRIDPEAFRGRALLYLKPEELRDLRVKIQEHRELIDALAADPSLATLLRSINREISSAMVGHIVSSFLGAPSEQQKEAAP